MKYRSISGSSPFQGRLFLLCILQGTNVTFHGPSRFSNVRNKGCGCSTLLCAVYLNVKVNTNWQTKLKVCWGGPRQISGEWEANIQWKLLLFWICFTLIWRVFLVKVRIRQNMRDLLIWDRSKTYCFWLLKYYTFIGNMFVWSNQCVNRVASTLEKVFFSPFLYSSVVNQYLVSTKSNDFH